ncbi:hypothetical protein BDV28DRAFT_127971 [Aspergillus coremiiformis]|uniref:Uncharacterized protein n=1 Tax=Aspergillus coremiiformis TaxID=138285 RepID=A0A5N6ZE90_9EURO|nr:hypothetical protein BDV28DRAFT_127971 [Aspergillus coremiiformis]
MTVDGRTTCTVSSWKGSIGCDSVCFGATTGSSLVNSSRQSKQQQLERSKFR